MNFEQILTIELGFAGSHGLPSSRVGSWPPNSPGRLWSPSFPRGRGHVLQTLFSRGDVAPTVSALLLVLP